jgi:hypothetical protein
LLRDKRGGAQIGETEAGQAEPKQDQASRV